VMAFPLLFLISLSRMTESSLSHFSLWLGVGGKRAICCLKSIKNSWQAIHFFFKSLGMAHLGF
jgi:hypothetical protein